MNLPRLVSLGFCLASAGMLGLTRAGEREPHRGVTTRWLDRSESYAKALPDGGRTEVAGTLCRLYVISGDRRRAEALIRGVNGENDRRSVQRDLMFALTECDGAATALEYARTLDRHRTRDELTGKSAPSVQQSAIFTVFTAQLIHRDFVGAETTLRLLDDEVLRSRGWYRMAQLEARIGLCDAASKSAANIRLDGAEGRETQKAVQKLIAEHRKKARQAGPSERPKGYIDSLRQTADLFTGAAISPEDLGKAEGPASKLVGAECAAAWRRIAWGYRAQGDMAESRRAIGECLKANAGPCAPHFKVVNDVSAADLYLELGEPTAAHRLAKKAAAELGEQDILKTMNGFTTGPLLVAILVRLGDVQQAVDVLANLPEDGTDPAAEVLGVSCVKEGKIAELEAALGNIRRARIKAVLCAAVAAETASSGYFKYDTKR